VYAVGHENMHQAVTTPTLLQAAGAMRMPYKKAESGYLRRNAARHTPDAAPGAG